MAVPPSALLALKECRELKKSDIRKIVLKKKIFEKRIRENFPGRKQVYLKYILHELETLRTLHDCKKKGYGDMKRTRVDNLIADRILDLFSELHDLDDDIGPWLKHIEFCFQVRLRTSASRSLLNVLKVHKDKPELWKLAARLEFEKNRSVENSQHIILRGIRLHPHSELLYAEAFRLELHFAEARKKSCKKNLKNSALQSCSRSSDEHLMTVCFPLHRISAASRVHAEASHAAEMLYNECLTKFNSLQFFFGLLSEARDFSFTCELQCKILRDMMDRYPFDELLWHTLATRVLSGLPCPSDYLTELMNFWNMGDRVDLFDSCNTPDRTMHISLKEKLLQCCRVYQLALKFLSTKQMWSFYLNTLIEINKDTSKLPVFKKSLLFAAFLEGHCEAKLREEDYFSWSSLNFTERKITSHILYLATQQLPKCSKLWEKRLAHHINHDEEEEITAVFQDGTEELDGLSSSVLTLWKMLIQYWQSKNPSKVEEIFQQGMYEEDPNISSYLKAKYLEWLILVKSLNETRQVYDNISAEEPYSLELHCMMIKIENTRWQSDLNFVRKCYDLACKQFGKFNVEVWLNYIKFELENGNTENSEKIQELAKLYLYPSLVSIFETEVLHVNPIVSDEHFEI